MTVLRLVVDNGIPTADAAALRVLETVVRLQAAVARFDGPAKAEIESDIRALRAVTLRIVARLAGREPGQKGVW